MGPIKGEIQGRKWEKAYWSILFLLPSFCSRKWITQGMIWGGAGAPLI